MSSAIRSLSSSSSNIRQDVFPIDQWTITTRKGIIMQSKCTCKNNEPGSSTISPESNTQSSLISDKEDDTEPIELCDVCRYHKFLPQLCSMPDMLFNNNLLRLEHSSGVGIEFNTLDALRLVEQTKDPLRVAVADGWQSARADFPYANKILKPFDWTFTTDYRGTLLSAIKKNQTVKEKQEAESKIGLKFNSIHQGGSYQANEETSKNLSGEELMESQEFDDGKLNLTVEKTDERIDVNRLKVREEILFYDDLTLYEDELADHGTAQYSIKVRVMPSSLFILARYYLRVDGVLARINDTRVYHRLSENYMLREYTNREAKLSTLNLPVSTIINPSELMNHLPLIYHDYEKLVLPV